MSACLQAFCAQQEECLCSAHVAAGDGMICALVLQHHTPVAAAVAAADAAGIQLQLKLPHSLLLCGSCCCGLQAEHPSSGCADRQHLQQPFQRLMLGC
jgi:hypothetical protein